MVETRAQWRQWLMQHHHETPGIYLVTWTKGGSHPPPGPAAGGRPAQSASGPGEAGAGQGERDLVGELREVAGEPVEVVPCCGGKNGDVGAAFHGGAGEFRDGGAGAEVFHPPSAAV